MSGPGPKDVSTAALAAVEKALAPVVEEAEAIKSKALEELEAAEQAAIHLVRQHAAHVHDVLARFTGHPEVDAARSDFGAAVKRFEAALGL